MSMRLMPIAAALLALAFASGAAHAQAHAPAKSENRVRVPVLDKDSGKLEAVLFLEPATGATGARMRFGKTTLEATYGLQAGDSLALLCDRRSGLSATIGQLASNCVLAALDGDKRGAGSRHGQTSLSLSRGATKVGVSAGSGRDFLPAWLNPGRAGGARYEQNDFSLHAERSVGRDSYVSVGGTIAKVHLVPASEVSRQLADQWDIRSVSVGGGIGAFSADVVGRVVNVPGEADVWQGVGLGLTWHTPWSGQLSVGAENIVTRGKNPFSPNSQQDDTVPYVRYQQDL